MKGVRGDMKNSITHYLTKEIVKSSVIISAILAGIVSLIFVILAFAIGATEDNGSVHNVVTILLLIWGAFVTPLGISISGVNMSIYMNCSRKAAIKAIFTAILLVCVLTSAIALAAEGLIAGVAHTKDFGYAFKPLFAAGHKGDIGISFLLIVGSYAMNVLLFYAVSVFSVFLVAASMKIGKWFWAGWWVVYMLLMVAGKSIVKALERFTTDLFGGSGASAIMCMALLCAAVFTVLDILIIKKLELRKSALMWANHRA